MGNRQRGGLLAQSVGSTFEEIFQLRCNSRQMGYLKIPRACVRYFSQGRLQLKEINTPFDCILSKDGKAATVDTKTIQGARFKFTDIVHHQLVSLTEMGQTLPSGYVIWFRESNRVQFVNYFNLLSIKPGTSFDDQYGLHLGMIETFNPELILQNVYKLPSQSTLF